MSTKAQTKTASFRFCVVKATSFSHFSFCFVVKKSQKNGEKGRNERKERWKSEDVRLEREASVQARRNYKDELCLVLTTKQQKITHLSSTWIRECLKKYQSNMLHTKYFCWKGFDKPKTISQLFSSCCNVSLLLY